MKVSPSATTASDIVRTIASAVVDLLRTEPALRADLQRALAAGKPANDDMLTTREASEVARVTVGSIRRWVRQGRLERHRAGRKLRISRTELEQWLRNPGPEKELTPEEQADLDFGG